MIIDDDALVRRSLQLLLETENYRIQVCESGKAGIEDLREFRPELVLLDLRLGDMDGLQVLRVIKQRDEQIQVIMLTAYGTIENTVQAMRDGAFDYVQKPFDNRKLKELVKKALQVRQWNDSGFRNDRPRHGEQERLIKIIGKSPLMEKVYEIVCRLAQSHDATVLIEGESGTGKELAASHIHALSHRCAKPFIRLNCACIPELLAESELFGYEKGAFTGGLAGGKAGKFQMAEGGTLFLDEVGDLSPEVQTKCLRVLEEKTYFRIGGIREMQCDVRVIAATNKNLLEEVQKGTFREDLYYRLSALRIVIPPLRKRHEDILPLSLFFLEQFCSKNDRPLMKISPEAEAILLSHPWKGNVRELRNAMERIVLLEQTQVIRPEHLEFLKTPLDHSKKDMESGTVTPAADNVTYDEMMEKLLSAAIAEARGNQTKAARNLGISRAKLRYQIAKYDLKT
jgi:DNA-binding NtrC family response regulator